MQNFKTLELAKQYYQQAKCQKMPRHLKDQFMRAAASISLNLAEGNAKSSKKEKLRYFEVAYGSFRECQTALDLEGLLDNELEKLSDHLGASLYKLTRSLMEKSKTVTKINF